MLQYILGHNQKSEFKQAPKVRSLKEAICRRVRFEFEQKALFEFTKGKELAKAREQKKRSYDNMSPEKQQLLKDFHTGKLQKLLEAQTSASRK